MNEQQKKTKSKFLSYILRHDPASINLELDSQGWADVTQLLQKAGNRLTFEELQEIVATNDKQRFSLDIPNNRIRANQGHSIDIELGLQPQEPPEYLYHGTASRMVLLIRKGGLQKMNRQHVHLSLDKDTATKVGARHGFPVVLTIRSGEMFRDGILFYCSDNNVWLTDNIPAKYIDK
ncbi:RNA 2'-phosphotransferase [Chitinophaga sp. Cy-1792]|uniref:RNA 2'-phosphotransferase n=1 Tax=Chitinophaga sp. Cy-1792 TaxID=2608339 RepID=UPI0014236C8B|nr:RNA 2'-phosphotransferase [Chitinophaga sp. Cy-1792]NIG56044.1 RNA 2'-phosphotransferase [Chitinophaga sp. Cy-1792]